jgi:hypothetical protein
MVPGAVAESRDGEAVTDSGGNPVQGYNDPCYPGTVRRFSVFF